MSLCVWRGKLSKQYAWHLRFTCVLQATEENHSSFSFFKKIKNKGMRIFVFSAFKLHCWLSRIKLDYKWYLSSMSPVTACENWAVSSHHTFLIASQKIIHVTLDEIQVNFNRPVLWDVAGETNLISSILSQVCRVCEYVKYHLYVCCIFVYMFE